MRIWDIHPEHLCDRHLLAEHRELHGLWNIITKHGGQGGYSHHPETKRWIGKTKALYVRHQALVKEFERRGFHHRTPLDPKLATGSADQSVFINTPEEQHEILTAKPCDCLRHI